MMFKRNVGIAALIGLLAGPTYAEEDLRFGASIQMTESKAVEAANLIRRGRVVHLGRPNGTDLFGSTGTSSDPTGTFLRALTHSQRNAAIDSSNNDDQGVETVHYSIPPIFTRGIMIDMVSLRGRAMQASDEITIEDMQTALEWQGINPPAQGDAVLFHTGWGRNWANGPTVYHEGTPGIGRGLAEWLVDREVAIIAIDSWSTVAQPAKTDDPNALSLYLLEEHGIFLHLNLETERIIDAEISEFAYIFAPSEVSGPSNHPGAPLALY